MKIASAELQMASSHASLQHHEISESLRMWSGRQRPDFEAGRLTPAPTPRPEVAISDAGRNAAASEQLDEIEKAVDEDPRTRLIRTMIEALTGRKLRLFDAGELRDRVAQADTDRTVQNAGSSNAAGSGFGLEYERHESYTEIEETRYTASGTVHTADGRKISFSLELNMSRLYHEESSASLRVGDAARKVDPLVINYSGTAASLVDQRFSFDLNADGKQEQIAQLGAGSGYLAFDRDADGRIDDGSELFGPRSGDGFAELAAFDDDGNGWIDENDQAFAQLSLWSPDAKGNGKLRSLAEAGVGAIALSRVATPFDLKNNANQLLGQIRTSGIFLHEDGSAGTIQQIDLSV